MAGISNWIESSSFPIWMTEVVEPLSWTWDEDGFGHPRNGFWRTKEGTEVEICMMSDTHILSAMKFLDRKYPHSDVQDWIIYRNLMKEAIQRGIHGQSDWDR